MLKSIKDLEQRKEKLESHLLISETYKEETNHPYYHKYSSACREAIENCENQIGKRHLLVYLSLFLLVAGGMFAVISVSDGSITGLAVEEFLSGARFNYSWPVIIAGFIFLAVITLFSLDYKKAGGTVIVLAIIGVAGYFLLSSAVFDGERMITDAESIISDIEKGIAEMGDDIDKAKLEDDAKKSAKLEEELAEEKEKKRKIDGKVRELKTAVAADDKEKAEEVEDEIDEINSGGGFGWIVAIAAAVLIGSGGLAFLIHRRLKKKRDFVERGRRMFGDLKEAIEHKEKIIHTDAESMEKQARQLPEGDRALYYKEGNAERIKNIVQDFIENKHLNKNIRSLCHTWSGILNDTKDRIARLKSRIESIPVRITTAHFNPILNLFNEAIGILQQIESIIRSEESTVEGYEDLFRNLRKFYEKPRKPDAGWKNKILELVNHIKIPELKSLLARLLHKQREIEAKQREIDELERVTGIYEAVMGYIEKANKWTRNTADTISRITEENRVSNAPPITIPAGWKPFLDDVRDFRAECYHFMRHWPADDTRKASLDTEFTRLEAKYVDEIIKEIKIKKRMLPST